MPDPLLEMIQERESENSKRGLEKFLRDKNLIITTNPTGHLDSVQLLTTDDICKLMKVDRHVVYELADSGELPGFKKKGWKFRLQDFQEYLAREVNKKR